MLGTRVVVRVAGGCPMSALNALLTQPCRRRSGLLQGWAWIEDVSVTRTLFSAECEKTFDVQMIMIIIERNRSRDRLVTPQALGRLRDYLLIRLITVFDPAFCRVFFFAL
jgi:hypothetical protein